MAMTRLRLLQFDLLRKQNGSLTLYDKTQLDYTYMEHILEHWHDHCLFRTMDLSKLRLEVEELQEKCSVWVALYDEAIYPQFARLLKELHEKLLTIQFRINYLTEYNIIL
jgi:hypothetical protein